MFIAKSKSKIARAAGVIAAVAGLTAASAYAADWPTFHGPDRDNKSKETGLLKAWPDGGPKLLWTASGAGEGYSGVTVSGGMIYTAGSKDKANYVFAYDLAGKRVWEKKVGAEWEASGRFSFARAYQGSRGTPAVDGGMVYYLSDKGTLAALDAKTGADKWSVNLHQKYESEIPDYGYSESPLVIGDRVYAGAFGKKAVVALDKKDGKVIWESPAVSGKGGFASIVPFTHGGVKQLVTFTSENVFGVNMDNGAMLWSLPVKNSHGLNCTDVLYHDGHLFVSSGYGFGSMLVKLTVADGKVKAEKVYETKVMDNQHGGIVLHGGYVYGSGHKNGEKWFCVDFKTGKQMWSAPGKGSITFADGMLYLYDEKGTMTLARAAHDKLTAAGSFKVPEGGKGAYWAHPAVSNGVLYLRHSDKIFAYDVKAK